MSSVPTPPGTQIPSSCGQSANVIVGVSVITESILTGSILFPDQVPWRRHAGNTCNGP